MIEDMDIDFLPMVANAYSTGEHHDIFDHICRRVMQSTNEISVDGAIKLLNAGVTANYQIEDYYLSLDKCIGK